MRFTDADIDLFARASGDVNPLHTDPAYARRTPFGRPLVHGIAVVLALLGSWSRGRAFTLVRLRGEFRRPVFPDRDHAVHVEEDGADAVVSLGDHVSPRVRVSFTWNAAAPPGQSASCTPPAPRGAPADLDERRLEQMREVTFAYRCDAHRVADIAARAGLDARSAEQLAPLLACSYVSGMLCPGRDGLLSEVELTCGPGADEDVRLDVRYDMRFRLVTLDGTVCGARARIGAFLRRPPVPLPVDDIGPGSGLFRDRVVLVTGSSRGFGAALALTFAREGADVVVNGRTETAELADAQRAASAMGRPALAVAGDVSTQEGCARIARAVAAAHGGLDVLVCNAAPVVEQIPLAELTEADLLATVDATVRSLHQPLVALGPLLADGGAVVFISSRWVTDPPAGFTHYVAGKGAGEALLRAAAAERPRVRHVVARMPRMLTDQTNPVADTRALARPAEVAAALARELARLPDGAGYVELVL